MGILRPEKKSKAIPIPKAEKTTPSAVRNALEANATKSANKKIGPQGSQSEANKMSAKERRALGKRYDKVPSLPRGIC